MAGRLSVAVDPPVRQAGGRLLVVARVEGMLGGTSADTFLRLVPRQDALDRFTAAAATATRSDEAAAASTAPAAGASSVLLVLDFSSASLADHSALAALGTLAARFPQRNKPPAAAAATAAAGASAAEMPGGSSAGPGGAVLRAADGTDAAAASTAPSSGGGVELRLRGFHGESAALMWRARGLLHPAAIAAADLADVREAARKAAVGGGVGRRGT